MCDLVTLCLCVDVEPSDPERCVYNCRVMGGRECGKTSFVRALIGQQDVGGDDDEAMTIKGLTLPDTQSIKYLVVRMFTCD